jgi:hypothetical protein
VAAWKRLKFDRVTIFGHQQVAGKQVSEIDDPKLPNCQPKDRFLATCRYTDTS